MSIQYNLNEANVAKLLNQNKLDNRFRNSVFIPPNICNLLLLLLVFDYFWKEEYGHIVLLRCGVVLIVVFYRVATKFH